MEKKRILFIDDDMTLGTIVTLALNEAGYETHYQTSLTAITSVINELNPHLLLLDVEIGKDDGIDKALRLKALTPDIPILFVSSHIESSEVARALRAGAVAYLKKPFELEELLAYVQRYTSDTFAEIRIGHFTLNPKERLLTTETGEARTLSLSECKLLSLLASHRNEVVTRAEIEDVLWQGEAANEQSLNNFIAHLRKYLQEDKEIDLHTVKGVGYKLVW